MSVPISRLLRLVAFLGASLLIVALGTASRASASTIYACEKKKGGAIRIVSAKAKCKKKSEVKLSWNMQGPKGATGPAGNNGANGTNGKEGAPGQPQSAVTFNVTSNTGEPTNYTSLFSLDGVSVRLGCSFVLIANGLNLEASGPVGTRAEAGILASNSEGKATEGNQSVAKDVAVTTNTPFATLVTNGKAPVANDGYVNATITTSGAVVFMQAFVQIAGSPEACVVRGSAFAIPT
jgi:hypothetical protein